MLGLAVGCALASAATTALSTATQHHSAGEAPPGTSALGLMRFLVRRPAWLLALALGPVGFTLHLVALHHGPIALVQPLAITGIVFAVPIRAAWSRTWPSVTELRAVVVTAVVLAVLLLASDPGPGERPVDTTTLLLAVAGCAAVAGVVLLVAGGLRAPTGKAFLLGSSAGMLFGLMAVLMEASASYVEGHGVLALAATWLPYALVASGLSGITINQVAYRTARLSASMPVLNVVNCLLALGFGYLVFHETPRSPEVAAVATVASVAALAWALWQLARYEDELATELVPSTT